jgi:hypothetical protein
LTEDWEENRNKANHITRCAVLSRFLILNYCVNLSTSFNPQRWLLLQTCQKIFGKSYGYNDDLFSELMLQLVPCARSSVINHINNMYEKICQISDYNIFPIILDEAQSLENILIGKFRSQYNKNEKRSLLSPIFQTLKNPTPSFSNNCTIPCGTGLGLLSLNEVLASTGISKPDQEIDKFTEFGGWEGISHVKNYVSNLVEFTDEEYESIYNRFHGRFLPIVTLIEEIIIGNTFANAVNGHWMLITKDKTIII